MPVVCLVPTGDHMPVVCLVPMGDHSKINGTKERRLSEVLKVLSKTICTRVTC